MSIEDTLLQYENLYFATQSECEEISMITNKLDNIIIYIRTEKDMNTSLLFSSQISIDKVRVTELRKQIKSCVEILISEYPKHRNIILAKYNAIIKEYVNFIKALNKFDTTNVTFNEYEITKDMEIV